MKRFFKKVWHFLWKDNSIYSWLANVVIAFILIKYVFFPLVGLLFGTSLPIVAVVSDSMEHQMVKRCASTDFNGDCNEYIYELCGEEFPTHERLDINGYWSVCGNWYEARNITINDFREYPFSNGFSKGDIMILRGVSPEDLEVGDVLVFQTLRPYPIIHRVVRTSEDVWATKGDHNEFVIQEYAVTDGRSLFRCYQDIRDGIRPSLCNPGTKRVTADTPKAIPVMDESRIYRNQIIGKAVLRVPYLGYPKILLINFLDAIGLDSASQVF